MKRRFSWFFVCALFSIAFTGSGLTAAPSRADYAYVGGPGNSEPVTGFASPADARAIIDDILDAVGVKASFEVRAAKIPNAAAAMAKGKRYILYNPGFIAAIHQATGSNRWAPISILAHEIGHHLAGHTLTATGSHHGIELEADEFSGFVLRKMGASLEDAQLAMRVASSRKASRTHPAREDRLIAIASGWERADGQFAGRSTPAKRRSVAAQSREKKPVLPSAGRLDERLIAYDVHFNGDPSGTYHVTVRNNLVRLAGNRLFVFGKMLPTNSESYPLALKTAGNVLLVSKTGQVLSTAGRKLGYVTRR